MKHIFLPFTLLFFSILGKAQSPTAPPVSLPQNVFRNEEMMLRSNDVQLQNNNDIWKEELKGNVANEKAWLNYYTGKRYESYGEHSRQLSSAQRKELDVTLAKMFEKTGSSFSFNYASYLHSERRDEGLAYLDKAYSINPNEPDVWDDMLYKAVLNNNPTERQLFAKKLAEVGYYSTSVMEYNTNVLNSIQQNGILITYGQLDTYPLYILQEQFNHRKDVKIICMEWLNSERYRQQLALTFGEAFKTVSQLTPLQHILPLLRGDVFVGLTVPPDQLSSVKEQLYCTGLAMKHSTALIANMDVLVFNWEKLFEKNQVNSGEMINRNYLLPAAQLRAYYSRIGNSTKEAEMNQQLRTLAQQFGVEKKVQPYLD